MTYAAIPTVYSDVQFRSRLEARWACFFDLLGWKWEYEPFDLDGWIPDFVLKGDTREHLIEVKPSLDQHVEAYAKAQAACVGTKWAWLNQDQAFEVFFEAFPLLRGVQRNPYPYDVWEKVIEYASSLGSPLAAGWEQPSNSVCVVTAPFNAAYERCAMLTDPWSFCDETHRGYRMAKGVPRPKSNFDLCHVTDDYSYLLTDGSDHGGHPSQADWAPIESLWKQAGNTVQWKSPARQK